WNVKACAQRRKVRDLNRGGSGFEMRAEQIRRARAYYAAGDWTAQLQPAHFLNQQLTLLAVALKFLIHSTRTGVVHVGLGVAGAGQLQIGLQQRLLRFQIEIAQAQERSA